MHELTPYIPGEQPKISNLIKLNTNENPYGPSPKVLAALQAEVADSLRLYPDPASDRVREAVAAFYQVSSDQVFVGNGSDEVLAHVFNALLKHEAPILFPDITYSFYPVYCGLYGIAYETVPLGAEFEIQVQDYMRPNGGIIFPNPNAPTGRLLSLADIARLLQANQESVVVVDEAYIDFGGESAASLVQTYPNLLVTHTLSKARSLAGLRVGFAIGQAHLIEALNRVKDSFNSYPLDRFAISGAVAALEDKQYFEETRHKVMATRESLVEQMQALGFTVLPSAANFIFARHAERSGAELAALLRERNIIVRHFSKPARISEFLRITIGTNEQSSALIQALQEILND